MQEWRRSPDGSYTVRDYHSYEFEQVVNSVRDKSPAEQQRQMKHLAELFDRNWEGEYRKYTQAECYDGANENMLGITTSSFHRSLVQVSWLPPKSPPNIPSLPSLQLKPLYNGRELYDETNQNRNLLYYHVPYIGAELKSADFVNLLQIRGTIDADEILAYLQQWSTLEKAGTNFCTTIDHMREVYLYLKWQSEGRSHAPSEVIKETIQEGALIFVPDESDNPSSISSGRFYSIHEVCWLDPTSVLYKRYIHNANESLPPSVPKLLQLHYHRPEKTQPTIKDAFIYFGVPETPRMGALIALLKHVSALSPMPEPQHVDDFASIAFHLVKLCEEQEYSNANFVYNHLKEAKVFPAEDHKWVSVEGGLFENDNPVIAKYFKESESIHFLQWPRSTTHDEKHKLKRRRQEAETSELKEGFIKICKIPKLSQQVQSKVVPAGVIKPSDELRIKLHHITPLIQRFLLTNCQDQYESLLQFEVNELLECIQIFTVPKLECVYSINDITAPTVPSLGCELEDDPPAIYVAESKISNLKCIIPALVKLFMKQGDRNEVQGFKEFLTELLLESPVTPEQKEDLANQTDLSPIPEGHPQWNIPLPVQQKTVEELSDADEEESSESEVDTADKVPQDESADEGLKSWPPRAAVDPQRPVQRTAGGAQGHPSWSATESDMKSADVIGDEDIQRVRQKHLQEFMPEDKDAGQQLDTRPSSRQVSRTHDDTQVEHSDKFRSPSQHLPADVQVTSNEMIVTQKHSQSEQLTTTPHEKPPNMASEPNDTSMYQDNIQRHSSTSQAFRVPDFVQPEAVDIRSIMQSVSLDAHELVPLLAEDDYDARKTVGRWGEEFVYGYLKKREHLPNGQRICDIQWVNENNETGNPYDIVVQLETETVYIEVKSTASVDKELIATSWKELKFAEGQAKNYHLYRVNNAGKSSTQLRWLENLHEYLQHNPIRFYLEL